MAAKQQAKHMEPKITRRSIADYVEDNSNANAGSERGLSMVEESLNQDGAGRSIVVDADGRIVAGNKTWAAAELAGIEDVIEIESDGHALIVHKRTDWDLTDVQGSARRYAYRDNRASEVSLSWSAEQLLADVNAGFDFAHLFSENELDELLADVRKGDVLPDAGGDVDRAAELQEKWQVKRGDLFAIGKHRLLCGDSTNADDVARLMAGERADACISDPPYNMDMTQGVSFLSSSTANMRGRVTPLADFDPTSIKVWMELGVSTFYLYCNKHLIPDYLRIFQAYNFNILVWCKTNPTPFTNGTYLPDVEYVMVFTLPSKIWNNSIEPTDTYSKFYQSSKLEGREDGGGDFHPTMKPIEFIKRHVLISSSYGGIVVDPFGGSGTTMVACEQLARQCRMIELEPKYCAVILERMSLMGVSAELVSL